MTRLFDASTTEYNRELDEIRERFEEMNDVEDDEE